MPILPKYTDLLITAYYFIPKMWIYSLGITLQRSIAGCTTQPNDKSPPLSVVDQRCDRNHNKNTKFTPKTYNGHTNYANTTASHNIATKAPDDFPSATSSSLPSPSTVTYDPHMILQPKANHHHTNHPLASTKNDASSLSNVIATMCHVKLQQRASLMYLLNVSALYLCCIIVVL